MREMVAFIASLESASLFFSLVHLLAKSLRDSLDFSLQSTS